MVAYTNIRKNPEILDDYLKYLKDMKNFSDTTIKSYEIDLRLFFKFIIEYKQYNIYLINLSLFLILKVTVDDIYSFLVYLNYYKNNSAATRKRKLAAIKSFYKWIYLKDPNTKIENPTKNINSITLPYRLPKYLSIAQTKKIQSIFNTENSNYPIRDNLIINMFLSTGMRISELLGINIKDINLIDNSIKVKGKGNKERLVYFSDSCKSLLEIYLNTRKSEEKALFLSSWNKRICKSSVENICHKAFKLMGIGDKHYSPHTLRHTFATIMYDNSNGNILLLKELLGHSSIQSTEIYTHVHSNKIKEAVEKNPLSNFYKTA